ncbi:MAG: hypothetical protein VB036_13010, partial [Propionicimonas sp.]|nr:hypothetical protein [Propionicimonas sp.]
MTTVTTRPAESAPLNRPRLAKKASAVGRLTMSIVIGLLFLFPVVWTILRSVQTISAAAAGFGPGMFDGLTLEHYSALQGSGVNIWVYTGNSALVALGTTAVTVVVATLAGYGLARLKFAGAGIAFAILLTPFMVPFQGILTPLF